MKTCVFEREPVPITGMPEAINYVSTFQQAEFEERLLDKKVEEFPIAMLMAYLAHRWYGSGFVCLSPISFGYHGFVDYCRDVTDSMILSNNVYSGVTTVPGCWNSKCGVLAIDWKHEEICIGEQKRISFRGLSLREFYRLLCSDKIHLYQIPGSDTLEGHCADWAKMFGEVKAPNGKYTIPRDYFYKVESHCDYTYVNLDFEMDFWRPWYLLPEEYEEIKRKQAARDETIRTIGQAGLSDKELNKNVIECNYKKQSAGRQTGIFVVSSLGMDTMENMHLHVSRVDNVRVLSNQAAWDTIKNAKSKWIGIREMYREARKSTGERYLATVTDQDIVEVTTHTVQYGFGDSCAHQCVEYIPIDVWVPYDDPNWMRVSTMPLSEMPANRLDRYRHCISKFTVTGQVLSQVLPKLEQFMPKQELDSKFSEFLSLLDKIHNSPKFKKPSEKVLYDKMHPYYNESNEAVIYRKRGRDGKTKVMLAKPRGTFDAKHMELVLYSPTDVDAEVKRLQKKFLNKWVINGRRYMRIDTIFPMERILLGVRHNFKDVICDNYVLPSILMMGPSINMDYWHPSCIEDDSILIEYDEYKTNEFCKRRIDRMNTVEYETIVENAKTAMTSKPSIMAECYSMFVNGVRDLIDGKKPKYTTTLPQPGIEKE